MEAYVKVNVRAVEGGAGANSGEEEVGTAVSFTLLDIYNHAQAAEYTKALLELRSVSSKRRCLQWRCDSGSAPDGILNYTDHTYYKQIEKDVPRIALPPDVPGETSFRRSASGVMIGRTASTSDGAQETDGGDATEIIQEEYHRSEVFRASLARVLHEYAIVHPEVGYVQGMHNVVAFMLIAGLNERESLTLLHHFATRVVPKYWHADAKNPILADVVVCSFIARRELPSLAHHLESIGVDLQQLTLPLFLTLFTTSAMPYEFVACCWDFLLFEASPERCSAPASSAGALHGDDDDDDDDSNNSFMFRVVLAMLKVTEPELLGAADAVDCIRRLVSMPTRFTTTTTTTTGSGDAGAESDAMMSVHELILLSAEFAETCAPKQIKLLRRELAVYSTPHIDDDVAVDEAEDGLGEARPGGRKERFQLLRSMSDSQHALQMQIDMMKETLSIQRSEMESMSVELDRLKRENAGLVLTAAEKELALMKLTKECTSLRGELDARKVQVNLLLDQQKEYLLTDIGNGKSLQRNESVGSVDGRRSPPSPPSSPRVSPRASQNSARAAAKAAAAAAAPGSSKGSGRPALFSRLRKNHT